MPLSRRGRSSELNIWPAFVDALGQLVIAIVFLLTILTIAQMVTTNVLSGKDAALDRLSQQINELTELLSLEKRANADLRVTSAQLSSELQSATAARDALTTRVAELTARAQDATARADRLQQQLVDANTVVAADREKIETQLRELESLRRDIEALRKVRGELEARVGALAAAQAQSQQDLTVSRDRAKELEARLMSEQERTALAQKDVQQRDIRLAELLAQGQKTEDALAGERATSQAARQQVEALNAQIAALREQLQKISAALDLSEAQAKEQQVQIVDLGRRLNLALASKVEELARYRSEFFGRLREVLGDRPDIRVVGDRFVFQSEVLFAPGSPELSEEAKRQLQPLAAALAELIPKIPNDLNWILRVDGHTDRRPISTLFLPSNWELSTARAISVVKSLVEQGIPASRLAATGFGEFQPVDPGTDDADLRRNRRIEIKLTER